MKKNGKVGTLQKIYSYFTMFLMFLGFFISINTAIPNIPDDELDEYKELLFNLINNELLIDGSVKGSKIYNFDYCVMSASKISS